MTSVDTIKYELVRMRTQDGIELQGLFMPPRRSDGTVLLHVHGWIGNFYENKFIDSIAARLKRVGAGFLAFNNRGSGIVTDFIASRGTECGYRRIGGSLENIAESLLDIDAAWRLVKKRGYARCVLQGHSLGCQKVLLYASKRRRPWLCGLVLVAPVDDAACAEMLLGKRYEEAICIAETLVRKGKGDASDVLPPYMQFYPMLTPRRFLEVSSRETLAGGVLDYSGSLPILRSIQLPILSVFGSKDQYQKFPQDALQRLSAGARECEGVLIEGAGHLFSRREGRLAESIAAWLQKRIL